MVKHSVSTNGKYQGKNCFSKKESNNSACQAPLSMWLLQARILGWVAMPSSGDLPNPGIKPRSPALQVDSLPAESPQKPKNTGVGSLSLLQGIFLTQESNCGLLHCRWILYQLSYQGSPYFIIINIYYRKFGKKIMDEDRNETLI